MDHLYGRPAWLWDCEFSVAGRTTVGLDDTGRTGKSLCAVGDCTYTDHLTFPVDPDMLRRLAAQYASGTHSVWAFKIAGKSAPIYTGGLSNAEIAGLLARADSYE